MKPLAKPSGITLESHRQHVFEQAKNLLDSWSNLAQKYQELVGADLEKELEEAAWWHDAGKKYHQWQDACQKDYAAYQDWLREQGLAEDLIDPHVYKRYEKAMRDQGKFAGKHIMRAKLRHEFASLKEIEEANEALSLPVRAAIAAHHGKLGRYFEKRWREDGRKDGESKGPFGKYFTEFKQENKLFDKKWEARVLERYKYAAVRSLLQLADTRASRSEAGEELAPTKPFELKKLEKEWPLWPVQKAAKSVANQPIAILRAPTGSGKTYASLLWADQQIKNKKADRLVIAMPTRFTSNALAISVESNVEFAGLYHSSAWFNRYGETQGEERSYAKELHLLAQKLATPVNVCTVDHLLMCLTGSKEIHHSTFFFLANSAVVFDEADFYDSFVQANIVVLIKTLRVLKVPILIMSATVPNSARELYGVELPIISPEPEGDEATRMKDPENRRRLKWAGKAEQPHELKEILDQMAQQENGIIYANTIARAIAYYRWFKQHYPELPAIMYHSRFTEPDKAKIEDKLLKALGKEAWEKQKARGIAILTQIGEMSVNISTTLMLSELCPWDRLAQRIGRLTRFKKPTAEGTVYVFEPIKNGALYPAPYGAYVKEKQGWTASEALQQTHKDMLEWHVRSQGAYITPEELVKRVNLLYPQKPEFQGDDKRNAESLVNLMKINWLIVPDVRAEEESESSVGEQWKSRHIPPQKTVLVKSPGEGFERYRDYLEFALEYGISVPDYLIEKELKRSQGTRIYQRTIHIANNDDGLGILYVADKGTSGGPTSYYNSEEGLSFLYSSDEEESASPRIL